MINKQINQQQQSAQFDETQPLNLQNWIAENKHLLKPPVANKLVWLNREFFVMIVGGPNNRTDFHLNKSEEFFYQLEGTLTLKTITPAGKIKDIVLNPGSIYLLPPGIPHSPQREAHSVGLVIERKRREGELDGLLWFCEKCEKSLYEEFFVLTDIETQFPAVFERYYNSEHTKCKSCSHINGRKWTHA